MANRSTHNSSDGDFSHYVDCVVSIPAGHRDGFLDHVRRGFSGFVRVSWANPGSLLRFAGETEHAANLCAAAFMNDYDAGFYRRADVLDGLRKTSNVRR
jgi:hypothetical protein